MCSLCVCDISHQTRRAYAALARRFIYECAEGNYKRTIAGKLRAQIDVQIALPLAPHDGKKFASWNSLLCMHPRRQLKLCAPNETEQTSSSSSTRAVTSLSECFTARVATFCGAHQTRNARARLTLTICDGLSARGEGTQPNVNLAQSI